MKHESTEVSDLKKIAAKTYTKNASTKTDNINVPAINYKKDNMSNIISLWSKDMSRKRSVKEKIFAKIKKEQ